MALQEKLKEIDRLQKEIEGYGPFPADIKRKIDYKLRLDWNYYSNSIEGGTLTREETRSVMIGSLEIHGKPLKDVMEMHGHDEVVLEILKLGKGDVRLSEKRIKDIHNAIMHEDDPEKRSEIGKWKSKENEIINYKDEKFGFAVPAEVAEKVHKLLDKTNAEIDALERGNNKIHPMLLASQFHLEFLTIHPFYDGNGRTARILTNLLLISFGYPPFVIKIDEKQRYSQLLADVQAYGGSPDLLYEFLADKLIRSQMLVLNALEGKDIEELEDVDKEIALFKKQLQPEIYLKNKKSNEITTKIFKEFIVPFAFNVWESLKEIRTLFIDESAQLVIRGFPLSHEVFLTDADAQKKIDGYLSENYSLSNAEVIVILRGFRHNRENPYSSLHLEMKFIFNDYQYILNYGFRGFPSIEIKKFYNNIIRNEEQINFIVEIKKQTLALMKEFV